MFALHHAGNGTFTAAYTVPADDLGVAHSSNGSHCTSAPGLVPVQGTNPVYGNSARSLSQGVATWYGSSPQESNQSYQVQLMRLSEIYRPPRAPSGSGIVAPRTGSLGSLAATAPGTIAKASFERTGTTVAKLVDALGGGDG